MVPATNVARLGTTFCDASDPAQDFTLPAGGKPLQATVEGAKACVAAVNVKSGVPIGACNSSNSSQIFRFSDDAGGQGTLCSGGGMCLCTMDPEGLKGAIGIAASEAKVAVVNASATRVLGASCEWKRVGAHIESMVEPPEPAVCTASNMSLVLGLPVSGTHCAPHCTVGVGNHTIAEAEKLCDARFECAGFTYHGFNDTAIDCAGVHEFTFLAAVTNDIGQDKSWKTFTKERIAYPYPDPRAPLPGQPMTRRCLTSGFAWPDCGVCDSPNDPCTCAFVYGSDEKKSLTFVQNGGVAVVNVSLPGSPTVVTVAPQSISLISSGVVVFNTATIDGCSDPESCTLPTTRQNTTIAGNASTEAPIVLNWSRWTEPVLLQNGSERGAHLTQSSRPLEQLNLTQDRTDYLLYQREFATEEATANATLHVGTRLGSALSVFIDGVFAGTNVALQRPYSSSVTLPISIGALSKGSHVLTVVSASMGISNYPAHGTAGPHGQLPAHGITGNVTLEPGGNAANTSLTSGGGIWSHRVGLLGEAMQVFAGGNFVPFVWANSSSVPSGGGASDKSDTLPLSWFRTVFAVPSASVASTVAGNASLLLDPSGMGRGHCYLNGVDLGRYYPAAPGAATSGLGGMLYLPPSLLEDTNVLVLGEELGARRPAAVRVVLSTLAPLSGFGIGQVKEDDGGVD